MDESILIRALLDGKVTFCTGVPDSFLHGFCSKLLHYPEMTNSLAANEGNAIGIAVGYHIACGKTPLVYMQNSGIGNAANPLASLAGRNMLGIPMVLLIGWRGDPDHADHVQHELQGGITPLSMDNLDIPFRILTNDETLSIRNVTWAIETARIASGPSALLVPKGVLSGTKTPFCQNTSLPLTREGAIEAMLDFMPNDAIFVATTGRAARELYYLREKRGESHDSDVLNVGAMGHASSIAYGMAIALAPRTIVCLDGDGSAIMHMGAFAAPSRKIVPNLMHVVLNNGMHESVGGQPTVGHDMDFTMVARGAGYKTVPQPAATREAIRSAIDHLSSSCAARFIDIHVRPGIRSDLPPLDVDPKSMKSGIMSFIRCSEA